MTVPSDVVDRSSPAEIELTGVRQTAADQPKTQPSFDSLISGEIASEFDVAQYLPADIPLPPRGLRGLIQRASLGRIRPNPSARERYERDVIDRIRARVVTARKIAFASAKGGVGKTTAALLCGHALATHRLDRIIALDANPDAGSLGYRVQRETEATLSDLLRRSDSIERYADVRALTNQSPSRLEVLASENDPAISQALGEADFLRVISILERFYSIVVADLGTGLLDSATQGIMRFSNQIVVVTAPSVDAGRVANFTLDFVERRSPQKAQNAVVLINNVRRDTLVDVKALSNHFKNRTRAVVQIPYDRHLASGGPPEWARLRPGTRDAYLEAAAAIADGFIFDSPGVAVPRSAAPVSD